MVDPDQISPVSSLYSGNNSDFKLLGYVIELIAGKSFEEAVSELVFEPLGLENCFFIPSDIMVNRFSVGHLVDD